MGTKMRPSHANLFVSFTEHQFFLSIKRPDTFHSFSDFVVYIVTTLIFPKNQRQCAIFSINVATLFLSFKQASNAPNKLIYRQHYKRLRRKILIAFHSLSHFTLATAQLDLSFLKL